MRIRYFLLAVAILAVVACQSNQRAEPLDPWGGSLVAYSKVVSERHGIVGYVKELSYAKEGYGEPYHLFHVYDLDFDERGVINELGRGTKYVELARDIAEVRGKPREEIALGAQPLAYNVGVILDVTGPVRLIKATEEDLTAGNAAK